MNFKIWQELLKQGIIDIVNNNFHLNFNQKNWRVTKKLDKSEFKNNLD